MQKEIGLSLMDKVRAKGGFLQFQPNIECKGRRMVLQQENLSSRELGQCNLKQIQPIKVRSFGNFEASITITMLDTKT